MPWADERQVRHQIDRAVGLALFDHSFAERLLASPALALEHEWPEQADYTDGGPIQAQKLHDFAQQIFDQFWGPAPIIVPPAKVADALRRDQTLGRVLRALADGLASPDLTTLTAERDAFAARVAVLEDTVRSQDALLTAAAHDLRNSLMSLGMRVDLLREQVDDEVLTPPGERSVAVVDGLTKIRALSSSMARLLDDLLGLARLKKGHRLNLLREPIDLEALVRRVVADYDDREHPVQIVGGKRKVLGMWDRWRLERVVGNLLSNALKYSPRPGAIRVSVRREPGDDGGWAVLSVLDHGMGIPECELPGIFEPFHRGPNVTAIGGLGIGLASSRQIALEHGGTLDVQSRVGAGSTFTLRLPLVPCP